MSKVPADPTFLVPGGAGFIGSHFVDLLLARYPDCRVVTLDKLTYAGSLDNLGAALANPRHEFIHGDICDQAVSEPLAARADYVINFAAETHVDRAILDGEAFARTDTLGTAVLLEAFRRSHGEGCSSKSRRTRSTGRSRRETSTKKRRWRRRTRTPPARPAPICWPLPTAPPTDCR